MLFAMRDNIPLAESRAEARALAGMSAGDSRQIEVQVWVWFVGSPFFDRKLFQFLFHFGIRSFSNGKFELAGVFKLPEA